MTRARELQGTRERLQDQLREKQHERLRTLEAFGNLLQSSEIAHEVVHDSTLFAKIVYLAVNTYGLKQARIAAAINMSSAAVGRWSKAKHLPPPHSRPFLVDTLRRLVTEEVAHELKQIESGQGAGRRSPQRGRARAPQS